MGDLQTVTGVSRGLSTAATATRPVRQMQGYWGTVWRRLRRDPVALAGAAILVGLILVALAAPLLPLEDPAPAKLNTAARLYRPFTPGHPLGTDQLGRDVLSRIIWGGRRSLLAGFASVLLALAVGLPIGLVSGFYSNWLSEALMRLIDILMAFPPIVLAIVVVSILGPGLTNAMIAVSVVGIPLYARLVRANVLSVMQEEYIQAAHVIGVRSLRLLLHHIVPNVLAPVLVTASFDVGAKILATASLSFLGLGTQPPQPDWGNMMAEGRRLLASGPHLSVIPGLFIFMVVLATNLLGDGLRDAMDPTMKDR